MPLSSSSNYTSNFGKDQIGFSAVSIFETQGDPRRKIKNGIPAQAGTKGHNTGAGSVALDSSLRGNDDSC
jgi:hypothetical protein